MHSDTHHLKPYVWVHLTTDMRTSTEIKMHVMFESSVWLRHTARLIACHQPLTLLGCYFSGADELCESVHYS